MDDNTDDRDGRPDPAARPGGDPAAGRAGGPRVAFLLAQVGAHAAMRFTTRLEPLGLTPAHAGILRLLSTDPELNQRALADRLQAVPSRLVALIDELEERGLVRRQRRATDRRSHVLRVTDEGQEALAAVREVATAHDADLTRALSDAERRMLHELLRRLAAAEDLAPDVHPGYRGGGTRG